MRCWIWHSLKSFSTGFELSIRCVSDLFLLLSGLCFSFQDRLLVNLKLLCMLQLCIWKRCSNEVFVFLCMWKTFSMTVLHRSWNLCFTDVPQKWLSFSQLRLIVLVFVVGLRGIWGRRGGIYDVLAWRAPWPPVLENVNCFCCRIVAKNVFSVHAVSQKPVHFVGFAPSTVKRANGLMYVSQENTSKQESHSFEKICHSLVELEKSRMCDWVGLCLLFVEPHVIGFNLPLRFPHPPAVSSFGFLDLSTPPTHRLYDKDYAF